jgi:hypothetical protein
MLCAILNYDYFENEKLYNTSRIKESDQLKEKLAKDNNIKLIVIPYYIKDRLSYIKEVVSTW